MFNDDERERINVFDWSAEFRSIVIPKGGGFDAVIGNPPYDVLEKDRGSASWPHEALLVYVRKTPALAEALGGKLNLFRFFAIRSLCLTKRGGRFGMIMPLALLGDISCAATRRAIFHRAAEATIECFPQKDNPARRVFRNAKLSTAIVCCTHTSTTDDPVVRVRTYPWNSFGDSPKDCVIKWSDAALLDPKHVPLPLLDEKNWRLCKRIYQKKGVQRLGDIHGISVTRGEINQTIYRDFISESPKHVRLLKGVEVGKFRLNDKLSQGKREWFDEEMFLKSNASRSMVELERIATQRITGVDEKWRVVAARTRPRSYFADSTNSVVIQEDAPCELPFILALLNSRFVQWRFKLTSTNNNVATNELEALPMLMNDTSQSIDECAVRLESLWDRLKAANSQPAKAAAQREIENWERRLDQLVYELYGLTDKEIAIVEDATRNE